MKRSFLTAAQLAKELQVHVMTVRRLKKEGKIPFISTGFGGLVRYDLDDVVEALKKSTKGAKDAICSSPYTNHETPENPGPVRNNGDDAL